MESIKLEPKWSTSFDDYNLRQWTETEDVKQDIKMLIAETSKLIKEEEEDYCEYSDGEIENDMTSALMEEKTHDSDNDDKKANGKKISQLDVLLTKICNGAPVSDDVSNKCLFQCSKCNDQFKGWELLKKHFKIIHPNQKLKEMDIDKVITRTMTHVCKICSALVVCDKYFIRRHLGAHKANLHSYFQDFWSNVTYSVNVIGNLCQYKCTGCKKEINTSVTFRRHKQACSRKRNFESKMLLVEKVYHKCKICDKSMLCDSKVLVRHFRRAHGISTEEYCKKTATTIVQSRHRQVSLKTETLKLSKNIGNFCVFDCNICKKQYHNSMHFRDHFATHRPRPMEPLTTYLTKGLSYQCSVCSKLMLCDKSVLQSHMRAVHDIKMSDKDSISFSSKTQYHTMQDLFVKDIPVSTTLSKLSVMPVCNLPIKEVTSKIGNLCRYKCPECGSDDFTNFCLLRRHCKMVHNRGLGYHPSLVTEARWHACLLCPKAVMSDRYFLSQHLRMIHKKNLPDYEKTFIQNGGKSLPTFTDWSKTRHNQVNEL